MEGGFGTLIYLLIGYICGVMFAPDVISPNFLQTDWYNIWTYAWILGWPFMLLAHYLTPAPTPAAPVVPPVTPVS